MIRDRADEVSSDIDVLVAVPFRRDMHIALRRQLMANLQLLECANDGFNVHVKLYDEPFVRSPQPLNLVSWPRLFPSTGAVLESIFNKFGVLCAKRRSSRFKDSRVLTVIRLEQVNQMDARRTKRSGRTVFVARLRCAFESLTAELLVTRGLHEFSTFWYILTA